MNISYQLFPKSPHWFFFLLIAIVPSINGQALLPKDTLVSVVGKVLDANDNTPIKAFFLYQKMPYGGNIGSTSSKLESGNYYMTLLKSTIYDVSIEAKGYFPLKTKVETFQYDDDSSINHDFMMKKNKKGATLVLKSLIFSAGQAEIQSKSFEELDRLASDLINNPSMKIQLEGHTDYKGSVKANNALARKRVESTKAYLVTKGVNPKQIKLKSFGGSRPLVRSEKNSDRTVNRRVEVRIL